MRGSGLRERKKLQTRTALIEAAVELCVKQGYDETTVDQIAALADVSPRTFSRYFPTKGSVVTAIVDDMDSYIAVALERQPAELTVFEALLRAHVEVFGPERPYQTVGFTRMAVMIQIVNSSASVRTSALSHQHRSAENDSLVVMARRLGVPLDHPVIPIVADTWTVLFANSFAGLGLPGNEPIGATIVCDRLCAAFELFRQVCSPEHPMPNGSGDFDLRVPTPASALTG